MSRRNLLSSRRTRNDIAEKKLIAGVLLSTDERNQLQKRGTASQKMQSTKDRNTENVVRVETPKPKPIEKPTPPPVEEEYEERTTEQIKTALETALETATTQDQLEQIMADKLGLTVDEMNFTLIKNDYLSIKGDLFLLFELETWGSKIEDTLKENKSINTKVGGAAKADKSGMEEVFALMKADEDELSHDVSFLRKK